MLSTRVFRFQTAVLAACAFAFAAPVCAQSSTPPISIGAGLRSSFVHTELNDDTLSDDEDSSDEFLLDRDRKSTRLNSSH